MKKIMNEEPFNKAKKLEKELEMQFEDRSVLAKALCHRSYLNENEFEPGHNERLEFLGDAVLELVVTEHLFENYPEKAEGILTDWRAALVNTKMLSETATEMGLFEYMLLSKGERRKEGKSKQYILADTFEAIIGAIYKDRGLKKARGFVKEYILKELPRIIEEGLFKDPKSELQEIAQEVEEITPEYEVLSEEGPDHNKKFEVGVFLNEDMLAKSTGSSKKMAEEKAAQKALKKKYDKDKKLNNL